MPDADTPVPAGALLTLAAVRGTAEQLARCATRHHWPVAVLAALLNRRARHVLITGAAIEGLIDYRRSGSRLNPFMYLLIRRLDDMAYGAGLWRGAIRDRTAAPLIPRLAAGSSTPEPDRRYLPIGDAAVLGELVNRPVGHAGAFPAHVPPALGYRGSWGRGSARGNRHRPACSGACAPRRTALNW